MQQAIEQAIIEDVHKRTDLPAEKLSVSILQPEKFPADVKLFRVEKRGSYGNIFYNYLVVGERFFTSSDEQSFRRLVSAQKFLERRQWDAPQLAALFLHLVAKSRGLGLVDNSERLEFLDNGAILSFTTQQTRSQQLEQWQIKIDASYHVSYTRS